MHRIIGLALCLSLSTAAIARASGDQWEKTYSLTGRPDLHVVTDDGSVTVDTWDRKSVEVRVTTQYWHIGPGDVQIEQEQDGNHIDFRVFRPHHRFNVSFSLGPTRAPIRVEIRLPRDVDLDVKTGDGGVTIPPLAGRISLHTGDGSIHADGLKGEITLSSGDGGITATGLDGSVEARTGDGRVRIDGRFDRLDLGSGDGGIRAIARAGSSMGHGWYLESGDGSVDLRIPSDLNAELDARTGDGHIHLDLPVRVSGSIGRRDVHGEINNGGPALRIRTGDGSIRIAAT
jgi:hypothetical protein